MQQQLVTPAAYAALRGLDKSTISRQIRSGIIPVEKVAGKKKPMINPLAADAARASNIDLSKSRKESLLPKNKVMAGPEMADLPLPATAQVPGEDKPDHVSEYTRERTKAVSNDAKLKELRFLKEAGELMLKKDSQEAAQKIARMLRDRILAAADDLTETVYNAEDENSARALLRAGLRAALAETAENIRQSVIDEQTETDQLP